MIEDNVSLSECSWENTEHYTGDEDFWIFSSKLFESLMSQSGNAENPVRPPPKPVRMAAIGSIEQFDAGTSGWPSYAARLDQFIAANGIEDPRKVATLLTVIGSPTFKLLQNLLAPAKPADKTYKELCAWRLISH